MDQGAFVTMKNMLFSDSMARTMFDALSQSCATVKVKSGKKNCINSIFIFMCLALRIIIGMNPHWPGPTRSSSLKNRSHNHI